MPRDAAIQVLISTLHQTAALFDQPDAVLARAYAPGKWTLRQLLIHVSDTETVLLDRLRRIASDEKPVLTAFDQDLWARHLHYGQRDMAIARQQFEVARRGVVELARILPDSYDQKTGTHSEVGVLSFASTLAKVQKHNLHHLEQANACVEGRIWKPQ